MKWFALVLLGCAAPKPPPLTVHAVAWNPNKIDVGKVSAIAEAGEDLFIFSSTGAHVLAGGSAVASDPSVKAWRAATTIPAADGNGSWVVALDDRGRLYRVRDRSKLESIAGRFGLEKSDVRGIAGMGPGRIAFRLEGGIAIVDGDRVARHDYAFTAIAGGGGHGAGIGAEGVRVFDPFRGVDKTYALAARSVTFDSAGRMVAADEHAVFREEDGKLKRRYVSQGQIGALTAAGDRVWFQDGEELGALEGDGVAVSRDLKVRGSVIGSPSGDAWVLTDGVLSRYSTIRGEGVWQTEIAPIFARVCAGCHGAGGSAGIDLSTAGRWDKARAAITKRVVVERTMPPKGYELAENERAAVGRWGR